MKQIASIMGMPITIEIIDSSVSSKDFDAAFGYFRFVDEVFSTYKKDSEISKLNTGKLTISQVSPEVREVLQLAELTRDETHGFFNIEKEDGSLDPSGIVKGWAIYNASEILKKRGLKNFFIDAGGDIQAVGKNAKGDTWSVGLQNPFNIQEIIKVFRITDKGVATSGTYKRGLHIYNPHNYEEKEFSVSSMTVIGPNVYEADRFATAAFVMGEKGIHFIESRPGFEGYMVDTKGIATYTSGLKEFFAYV